MSKLHITLSNAIRVNSQKHDGPVRPYAEYDPVMVVMNQDPLHPINVGLAVQTWHAESWVTIQEARELRAALDKAITEAEADADLSPEEVDARLWAGL